jgi:hypothetical protein
MSRNNKGALLASEYARCKLQVEETETRKGMLLLKLHHLHTLEDNKILQREKDVVSKVLTQQFRDTCAAMQASRDKQQQLELAVEQARSEREQKRNLFAILKQHTGDIKPKPRHRQRKRQKKDEEVHIQEEEEESEFEEEEEEDVVVVVPRASSQPSSRSRSKLRQKVVPLKEVVVVSKRERSQLSSDDAPTMSTRPATAIATATKVKVKADAPVPPKSTTQAKQEEASALPEKKREKKASIVDLSVPYEPPASAPETETEKKSKAKAKANPKSSTSAMQKKVEKTNASATLAQNSKVGTGSFGLSKPPSSVTATSAEEEGMKRKTFQSNGWSGTSCLNALPPNLLFGENFKVPKLLKK